VASAFRRKSGPTEAGSYWRWAIALIVAAVASSVRNRPIAASTAVFGEVGLAGEVRGISQSALRVREAGQMGFTRCIVPHGNCAREDVPSGLQLIEVKTVSEAIDQLMEW